jgi:2-polyprenyl-3-methyl-5-hydroxy-6-metoxy-1,4-benzoquinol methylase
MGEKRRAYWEYQYHLGKDYLIPLLSEWGVPFVDTKVMDIGCAEGGILCAFADIGVKGLGLEISNDRLTFAQETIQNHQHRLDKVHYIIADFFHLPIKKDHSAFDIILLRDVLEHLIDKKQVMATLAPLMGKNTFLFITFPPFYAPFGGHQQMLKSWLRRLPYFHTLPFPFWNIFRWYIKRFDANPKFLKEMEKIRRHRITIQTFIKLVNSHGYQIQKNRFYITRPSYRLRFGWPVIISNRSAKIPVLREFLISGAFFLLKKEKN